MVGVEFDYIVVGAGAAGCVLAGRLAAATPRLSVLLIEYGGRAVNPLLHIPKGFYYTLRGDRYLYRYRTQPVTPDGADEVWLRGRVLGGSAAVNGMMWMRGAQADWDGLAARGNQGWSWADVLPAYKAMENHSLGPSDLRGSGGPLGVTVADTGDPVTAAILASAVGHGWDHVEDANASDGERIAFTPSTISGGRRTTSYDAYVRPALAARRRGSRSLAVATRTRVGRLLFDGRRCSGVRVLDHRREPEGHPGPPGGDRLRRHGRDAAAARAVRHRPPRPAPGGGHRAPGRVAQRRERVIEQRGIALQVTLKPGRVAASRLSTRRGQAVEALRYLRSGRGPLATAGYDLVCQFKSAPDQPRPDVQGLFVPMALDTASADMKLARHPGILFMAYPIRPQTRSTVHITGQDPADPPVIAPRFLQAEADRRAVGPVLGIAREILATSPIADLIAGEEFPGPAVTTPEEAVRYSLATGTGVYHAVGAAAMGVSADDVTDPQLRVRGVEGLRIADASVLPVQVSGNTGAPAMLVGYRAADLILDDV